MDFDNEDLVDGVLTIPHGLHRDAVVVAVYNDSWEQVVVMPERVDEDNTKVDLTNSAPISETWHALAIG
jgi:hypothetical protein